MLQSKYLSDVYVSKEFMEIFSGQLVSSYKINPLEITDVGNKRGSYRDRGDRRARRKDDL